MRAFWPDLLKDARLVTLHDLLIQVKHSALVGIYPSPNLFTTWWPTAILITNLVIFQLPFKVTAII